MNGDLNFSSFQLNNGLRVVNIPANGQVAHCALFINAGTRDEKKEELGLAHFIEHTLFKGTKNRRSYHILNRLDSVGGDLDAYTTKEYTCIHASFLPEYFDRALELISDIVKNSVFPPRELEKEKEVIIDEIRSYEDSPADQIYDDFEAQVFHTHPLGNQILGDPKSVRSLNKQKVENYMERLYTAPNMVLSCASPFTETRLKKKVEKYFSDLSADKAKLKRTAFQHDTFQKVSKNRNGAQTHCMIGRAVFGMQDPNRIPFILLNNILGGPAMNSILNMKVRERFGYAYNIESNYTIYSDSGLFSIYLGTDQKHLGKCLSAIHKELKLLRTKKLSVNKLHLAKQQLKGQISLGRENLLNVMLSNGRSILYTNQIRSLESIFGQIDQITDTLLMDLANEYLNEKHFDSLYFTNKV